MNPDDNIGQAIIFEMLVEQEIDKDIKFKDIILNPYKEGSMIEKAEVKKAFKVIIESDETTPQTEVAAIQELKFFLLKTFPNIPTDGNSFGENFLDVILDIYEGKNEFTNDKLDIFNIIKQK